MPDPIAMPDQSGEPTRSAVGDSAMDQSSMDKRSMDKRSMDESPTGLSTADLAEAGRARPAETRSFEQAEPRSADSQRDGPLFPSEDAEAMRRRWTEIQGTFVDEPRRAVEQADGLVAEAIKKLAEMFASERDRLEGQWARGDDVDTEDLRQALQRYRAFFTRLLSV